jgi:hypothetical protein
LLDFVGGVAAVTAGVLVTLKPAEQAIMSLFELRQFGGDALSSLARKCRCSTFLN